MITRDELIKELQDHIASMDRVYREVCAERDRAQAERDDARASLARAREQCDTMIALHDEIEQERDELRAHLAERVERTEHSSISGGGGSGGFLLAVFPRR